MPKARNLKEAHDLIEILNLGRVRAVCPRCQRDFSLKNAGLFHMDDFSDAGTAWLERTKSAIASRREELRGRPRTVSARSDLQAGAVNLGSILERLAPSLATFPFRHSDCRSLFDPIDYIVFPGAECGSIESIEFVEIKSGGSRLTKRQRQIRDVVERGRVSLSTYK